MIYEIHHTITIQERRNLVAKPKEAKEIQKRKTQLLQRLIG